MLNVILIKSKDRFLSFKRKLSEYGLNVTILDFEDDEWIGFNYVNADILIYFPAFQYSSNSPHAISDVCDNLKYIKRNYPTIKIFPDPNIIDYYNDKYRQYLFLNKNNYPIPDTFTLLSENSLTMADEMLGYPIVL